MFSLQRDSEVSHERSERRATAFVDVVNVGVGGDLDRQEVDRQEEQEAEGGEARIEEGAPKFGRYKLHPPFSQPYS